MDVRLRRADAVAAVIALLFVAAAWNESAEIPAAARFFPRIILVIMAGAAAVVLVRAVRRRNEAVAIHLFGEPGPFLGVLSALIVYVVAIPLIGYFSATFVFIPLVPMILGARRFRQSLFVAALFCVSVYLGVVVGFERRLPAEFWAGWLQ